MPQEHVIVSLIDLSGVVQIRVMKLSLRGAGMRRTCATVALGRGVANGSFSSFT